MEHTVEEFPCNQMQPVQNNYYFFLFVYYVQITYTLDDAATCTNVHTHMLTPKCCLCL